MRIGIYGGSFNPPHIGHLYVADMVMSQVDLDIIVFVPAGDPYMKPKEDMAPAEDRLNMVKIATKSDRIHYRVSDIEVKRSGSSYTADTILEMKALHPYAELFLIVGGDAFVQMPEWNNLQTIMDNCKLIIVCRDDKMPPYKEEWQQYIEEIVSPIVQLNISSTKIRNSFRNRMPIKRLLPPGVSEYIIEHGLYCR